MWLFGCLRYSSCDKLFIESWGSCFHILIINISKFIHLIKYTFCVFTTTVTCLVFWINLSQYLLYFHCLYWWHTLVKKTNCLGSVWTTFDLLSVDWVKKTKWLWSFSEIIGQPPAISFAVYNMCWKNKVVVVIFLDWWSMHGLPGISWLKVLIVL